MRVTDEMVEAAVIGAFREAHRLGWALSDKRWDRGMPESTIWRAALEAALSHAAGQDGEQCRAASGEDAYVIEQMGRLLAEIAVIVNGPEPPMTRWSYHDLPEKVRALSRGLGDEVKFALYQLEQMAQGGPLAFDAAIIRAAANLLRALAKKAAEA